jgi:hypothetical protein
VKKSTPGKNELCIKIHPTAATANDISILCQKELIFLLLFLTNNTKNENNMDSLG